MISRYEWLYTKSRIAKLEDILSRFEQGFIKNPYYDQNEDFANMDKPEWLKDTTYANWKEFISLNHDQQVSLIKQWDDYYEECRNSESGKIFFSMKQAYLTNNKELIKEIAQKAKDLSVSQIKKPSTVDPNELRMKMGPYFLGKQTLKKLKEVYETYKDVYMGKSERAEL